MSKRFFKKTATAYRPRQSKKGQLWWYAIAVLFFYKEKRFGIASREVGVRPGRLGDRVGEGDYLRCAQKLGESLPDWS